MGNEKKGDNLWNVEIDCPFDQEVHKYKLIYRPESVVTYGLYLLTTKPKKALKGEVKIVRTFVCPNTKEKFSATISVPCKDDINPDRIMVSQQ